MKREPAITIRMSEAISTLSSRAPHLILVVHLPDGPEGVPFGTLPELFAIAGPCRRPGTQADLQAPGAQ